MYRKKPLRRPKKTGADRSRRERLHVKQLVELGVDADAVGQMNPKQVMTELRKRRQQAAEAA